MRQSTFIQVSIASVLGLLPSTALALGLGNMQVLSEPGHPFKAIIPVQSITHAEGDSLLAGFPEHRNTYTLAGIQVPAPGWKAVLVRKPTWHILVTAPTPVTQATSLLVQAQWSGGQVMREYALPRGAAASAVEAPVHPPVSPVKAVAEKHIAQQAPSSTPLQGASLAGGSPSQGATPSQGAAPLYHGWSRMAQYRVRAGQCLSEIAVALRGNETVTPDQIMAALVRANPAAFVAGDPNQLRSGVVLTLPNMRQVQAMTPTQAFAWMRGQAHSAPSVASLLRKKSPAATPPKTAPATKLILTSAPSTIHPVVKKVVSPAERLEEHRLLMSDQVLQKKMQSMDALTNTMQDDLVKENGVIQNLRHTTPGDLQQMLPWASIGGNVLLLMLFVWMWRRQEKMAGGSAEYPEAEAENGA
ncbi:FimV family protein [Acidithiobacillus thiooxidans]|uniref:type IV pilus assembly protein FimV n=1 Tax=Acidithiobacillus thiooxidans TaxID=930 RepID=UPI0004E152EA|nr:FimV/HubP family polar landmark protein [Acidithiobacillus thiooxidans]